MEKLFQSTEHKILGFLSVALGFNTLFFIAREIGHLKFLVISSNTHIFYFLFAALGIFTLGTIAFFSKSFKWHEWLGKTLLVFFPTATLIIFALSISSRFHYVFQMASGFYIVLTGLLLVKLHHQKISAPQSTTSIRQWFRSQKRSTLLILVLLVAVHLGFGTYRVAQFAAVDEALWTFGKRISKYWDNIAIRNWEKTKVSDKPGVTVSIISGAGLLFENPKDYKLMKWEGVETKHPKNDIQKMNLAFRLPIVIFGGLMLFVLYFFLERLVRERKALLATILVGTSPILIGMERIINPDSILWIFSTLAILSYFIFLKRKHLPYLYWAGIFLGLALLTKYVANIIFVFFFGIIFLEYIFMSKEERSKTDIVRYIKTSFLHYIILTFIALAVFYTIYPAVWVRPSRLLDATLLSQAFESTWPIFIAILSFIFIDQWVLKNRVTQTLLDSVASKKHWLVYLIAAIFSGSVIFVLINIAGDMRWYDFEKVLGSPKTSYHLYGFPGVFFGNFYPLLFNIHAIAFFSLIGIAIVLFIRAKRMTPTNIISLYGILFILLYYLGSTVNHVATIARYQVMLFPITLILAGIFLGYPLRVLTRKFRFIPANAGAFVLLGITTISLFLSSPLYLGYASVLLPKEYITDIKDMGDGSYEAAAFLNQLPNAKEVVVWTDKNGVCQFFVGSCYTGFNFSNLKDKQFDYFVLSSGRASRTENRVPGANSGKTDIIPFNEYYTRDNAIWSLLIDGRPKNFVKIVPYDGGIR